MRAEPVRPEPMREAHPVEQRNPPPHMEPVHAQPAPQAPPKKEEPPPPPAKKKKR
jgi:hypothetical protein